MIKDRFSETASKYAEYRPGYPPRIAEYLSSLTQEHQRAWDCATGSGQAAAILAPYFQRVIATDGSVGQVMRARRQEQVEYAIAAAEQAPFTAHSVDQVTVAKAIQWFNFRPFYEEVKRVLKTKRVIAAWGYHHPEIEPAIDRIRAHYFYDVLGPYLPSRLTLVEQHYRTIPFPFKEITGPAFCHGHAVDSSPALEYAVEHVAGRILPGRPWRTSPG